MTENNRVAVDWERMRPREERYENYISGPISKNRIFLLEKLSSLESLKAKYTGTLSPQESLLLRVLDNERKKLAKEIYPNRFLRFIRNLIVSRIKRKAYVRQSVKNDDHLGQLKERLKRNGFEQVIPILDQKLGQSGNMINIPVSHYVSNSERMNFELSFSRDVEGNVHVVNLVGELTNDLKPGLVRKHSFSLANEQLISSIQAYNLLDGRPIRNGNSEYNWQQLDFNDKNQYGSYGMKEYKREFDERLEKVIDQLPVSIEEKDSIQQNLYYGNKSELTIGSGNDAKAYSLSANLQGQALNVFDEKGDKIHLGELLKVSNDSITVQSNQKIEVAQKSDLNMDKPAEKNITEKGTNTLAANKRHNRRKGHGKRHRAA